MLYNGCATDALTVRPTCDLCAHEAIADAATKTGPWAYLCTIHYLEHAVGLGEGRGQYLLCGDDADDILRGLLESK